MATAKWLKENNVDFSAPSHDWYAPQLALTPHRVPVRDLPKLEDILLTPPLLCFGEYGTSDIFGESGEHVQIEYKRGRVASIRRQDSRTLNVYTDDLGNPIAIEISGGGAAAFSYAAKDYALLYTDVLLQRKNGRVVGVSILPVSKEAPEADPWGLINTIARNFIRPK